MAEKRSKQKKRRKSWGPGSVILLLIAIGVFGFSLYQLAMMLLPYHEGRSEYNDIRDLAIVMSDEATIVGEDGEIRPQHFIDFDVLKQVNSDTVAWIRFDNPEIISYPVVHSRDNEEYLTRTFSHNSNRLGAIFLDMDNSPSFTDPNTFIYGHNMRFGGDMFSQLIEFEDVNFFNENPYFYIYTPDGLVRTYRIFAARTLNERDPQYQLHFVDDEDFSAYLEMSRRNSLHQREGMTLTHHDRIVSLSTCTNVRQDQRFLLQGVLVEERPLFD